MKGKSSLVNMRKDLVSSLRLSLIQPFPPACPSFRRKRETREFCCGENGSGAA